MSLSADSLLVRTSEFVQISSHRKRSNRIVSKRATCTGASLYTYPASNVTIDVSTGPVSFTWDTSCLNATTVDLTLYAPSLSSPIIQVIEDVQWSKGTYSATLLPKMWGNLASVGMQLKISDPSLPSFLSSIAAGPVFTVTYPTSKMVTTSGSSTITAAAANTASAAPVYVEASAAASGSSKSLGISKGGLAAAVLLPLLALIGVGVFFYIRFVRAKEAKERERWSQAIDNRMSVISQSWVPRPSGVGSRPSGDQSNNRATKTSSFFGRTSSTFAVEGGNFAGAGAKGGKGLDGQSTPEMRQSQWGDRPSLGRWSSYGSGEHGSPRMSEIMGEYTQTERPDSQFSTTGANPRLPHSSSDVSNSNARKSRVSFAVEDGASSFRQPRISMVGNNNRFSTAIPDGRPSTNSRRSQAMPSSNRASVVSRLNNAVSGSASMNTVNTTPEKVPRRSGSESPDITISPNQAQGPWDLAEAEVDQEFLRNDMDYPEGGSMVVPGQGRPSIDEGLQSMEAVMLMRNSRAFSVHSRSAPSPTPQSSSSVQYPTLTPIVTLPTIPQPSALSPEVAISNSSSMAMAFASSTSPDDMLRAYAAQRSRPGFAAPGTPTFDIPPERSLYNPAFQVAAPAPAASAAVARPMSVADKNPFRQSMAGSDHTRYSTTSSYYNPSTSHAQ